MRSAWHERHAPAADPHAVKNLRRDPGGRSRRPDRDAERDRHDRRSQRGRQIHTAALRKPDRDPVRGRDPARRRQHGRRTAQRPPCPRPPHRDRAQAPAHRHGVPALQPVRPPDRARQCRDRPAPSAGHEARRRPRPGRRAACPGPPVGSRHEEAGATLRRPAAARGDRARDGDEADADAVRRTDLGAGPRAGRRGAGGDPRAGRGRHDDAGRDARDAVRPRGRHPRPVHGRRPCVGRFAAKTILPRTTARAVEGVFAPAACGDGVGQWSATPHHPTTSWPAKAGHPRLSSWHNGRTMIDGRITKHIKSADHHR